MKEGFDERGRVVLPMVGKKRVSGFGMPMRISEAEPSTASFRSQIYASDRKWIGFVSQKTLVFERRADQRGRTEIGPSLPKKKWFHT